MELNTIFSIVLLVDEASVVKKSQEQWHSHRQRLLSEPTPYRMQGRSDSIIGLYCWHFTYYSFPILSYAQYNSYLRNSVNTFIEHFLILI